MLCTPWEISPIYVNVDEQRKYTSVYYVCVRRRCQTKLGTAVSHLSISSSSSTSSTSSFKPPHHQDLSTSSRSPSWWSGKSSEDLNNDRNSSCPRVSSTLYTCLPHRHLHHHSPLAWFTSYPFDHHPAHDSHLILIIDAIHCLSAYHRWHHRP